MALAARCPECNTAFRIVPDQLKISEGWVRCGHCSYVFNARQTQFEISEAALEQTLKEQKKQNEIKKQALASFALDNTASFTSPSSKNDVTIKEVKEDVPEKPIEEVEKVKEAKKVRESDEPEFSTSELRLPELISQSNTEQDEIDQDQQDDFSFSTQLPKIDGSSTREFIELSEETLLDGDDGNDTATNNLDEIDVISLDSTVDSDSSPENLLEITETVPPDEFSFEDTHLSEFHLGWQDSITATTKPETAAQANFANSTIAAKKLTSDHISWDPDQSASSALNASWKTKPAKESTKSQSDTYKDADGYIEFSLMDSADEELAVESLPDDFAASDLEVSESGAEEITWPASLSLDPQDEELEVNTAIGFIPTAFENLSLEAEGSEDIRISSFDEPVENPKPATSDHLSRQDKAALRVAQYKKSGAVIIPAHKKKAGLEITPEKTQKTKNSDNESISALPFDHSYFQPTRIGSPAPKTEDNSKQRQLKATPQATSQNSLTQTDEEEKDFVTTVLDDGYLDSQNQPYQKKKRSSKGGETLPPASTRHLEPKKRRSEQKMSSTYSTSLEDSRHSSRISSRIEEEPFPQVSFAKTSKMSRFWQNPIVRLGQWLAFITLSVLLLLQLGIIFRESLAINVPALRPVLTSLCKPFGCTVDYPRNLKDIAIYDSSFRRANSSEPDLYTLMLLLKNQGQQNLALPWIELTLSDNSTGEIYSRKVFSLQDLGVEANYLKANQEIHILSNLKVKTKGNMTLGFQAILFYP